MFKVGDIVEYIGANVKWKNAKLKFRIMVIYKDKIITENLQNIPGSLDGPEYNKEDILYFSHDLLNKCIDKKNHLPKWF